MRIVDFSLSSSYPQSVAAGAGNRIFNLNSELSKRFIVFQFSFMPSEYIYIRKTELLKFLFHISKSNTIQIPLKSRIVEITEKYTEFTFANPFFLFLDYISWRMRSRSKLPVFVPSFLDQTSLSLSRRKIIESDLVQVETLWHFDWVYKNMPKNKPIVLVAHDVDFLKHQKKCRKRILQMIREREKRAVEKADEIFVVSEDDQETICKEYCVGRSKIHIVPNGIDTSRFKCSTEEEKKEIKRRFGFSNKIIVLFVGSSYFPNIEAVERIRYIASNVKEDRILFLIAGSVGEYVRKQKTHNVSYTGYINDIQPYFRMADIAINPVVSGGGTNIKMLEYLASGLPVITTSFGARGLRIQNNKHVLISNIDEFPEKIEELILNKKRRMGLSEEGRKVTVKHYDWKVIAKKAIGIYDKITSTRSE